VTSQKCPMAFDVHKALLHVTAHWPERSRSMPEGCALQLEVELLKLLEKIFLEKM
jgi:hypothetical protein